VLQGKYALDPKNAVDYKPDIVTTSATCLATAVAEFQTG
jgi:hypothetical protein